jgi:hypothetical protein
VVTRFSAFREVNNTNLRYAIGCKHIDLSDLSSCGPTNQYVYLLLHNWGATIKNICMNNFKCFSLLFSWREWECRRSIEFIAISTSFSIFSMAQQPLVGQDLLIFEALKSRHTSFSKNPLWSSDQPDAETLPDNTQQSQETDIHVPGGIRTRNPNIRAAAYPRLRPRRHGDRHKLLRAFTYRGISVCDKRALLIRQPRHFHTDG